MKFRSALVPVVNLCSNAWIIIFMIGLFAGAAGRRIHQACHHHVRSHAAVPARHSACRV